MKKTKRWRLVFETYADTEDQAWETIERDIFEVIKEQTGGSGNKSLECLGEVEVEE
jgi:hypothetical protein